MVQHAFGRKENQALNASSNLKVMKMKLNVSLGVQMDNILPRAAEIRLYGSEKLIM
jgi:hypothetical protein